MQCTVLFNVTGTCIFFCLFKIMLTYCRQSPGSAYSPCGESHTNSYGVVQNSTSNTRIPTRTLLAWRDRQRSALQKQRDRRLLANDSHAKSRAPSNDRQSTRKKNTEKRTRHTPPHVLGYTDYKEYDGEITQKYFRTDSNRPLLLR